MTQLKHIKPGWYLMAIMLLWLLIQGQQMASLKRQLTAAKNVTVPQSESDEGFRLPIVGACIPKGDGNLPNAPREYRKGISQGFVFIDIDACAPVGIGTGVVATAAGKVIKVETNYKELDQKSYKALLEQVKNGANDQQLDQLRGREIWILHADGYTSVYGHLAGSKVKLDDVVKSGQLIGWVGNSGTESASRGKLEGARLLFELWDGKPYQDQFFGQSVSGSLLREKAKLMFDVDYGPLLP